MKPADLLPPIVPLLAGLLVPTIAFYAAQHFGGYTAGEDSDVDAMVARAQSALPLVTAVTIPGFVVLGGYLFIGRARHTPTIFWLTALLGTLVMAAIVVWSHAGMYHLLYARGRMHSTAGIGIMFVSVYCVITAFIVILLARVGEKIWQRRRGTTGPAIRQI